MTLLTPLEERRRRRWAWWCRAVSVLLGLSGGILCATGAYVTCGNLSREGAWALASGMVLLVAGDRLERRAERTES